MGEQRVFNFSAGPSVLPLEVLERAGAEITNYRGSGMSVMEMSHRSGVYDRIFHEAKERLGRLFHVPEGYRILFLQGGASTQFSMVPLNLMGRTGRADYAVTGHFSGIAWKEAQKYGTVRLAASSGDAGHTCIPAQEQLSLDPEAGYFHYCANNTIYGTEWPYVPDTGNVPLVCDMSSNLLSRRVDVARYGIIYGGAQKNLAPAGLTIVIIREDLLGGELPGTPLMLGYKLLAEKDSMYNTPPCWCIYMLGLVLEWLEDRGGVEAMERCKRARADLLYGVLDESRLFTCPARPGSRSDMNVIFRSPSGELDARFLAAAQEAGLVNLKGHRLVGGMRASMYNAMPMEGVERLAELIWKFDREN